MCLDVVQEMTNDFNPKATPLLAADPAHAEQNLIIASILEKEVPDEADQEIVAGIILKRLAEGIPLDIDSTVCYAKLLEAATSTGAELVRSRRLTLKSIRPIIPTCTRVCPQALSEIRAYQPSPPRSIPKVPPIFII